MSALVELITAWEAYASHEAEPTVAGFCQRWLARHKAEATHAGELYAKTPPGSSLGMMGKLIGRLGAMQEAYTRLAFKAMPGAEPEQFYVLNMLNHLGEARKTELISANFMEHATGLDLLNRLIKAGYVTERPDPADGRARLLRLTDAGRAYGMRMLPLVGMPVHFLYNTLSEEDRALIIALTAGIELKHEQILARSRGATFTELLDADEGAGTAERLMEEFRAHMAAYVEAQGRAGT